MKDKISNIIEIENLTRKFGDFIAVDHICLEIKKGEIFGFLGPNGAGKTTITKILCTILNPTSGMVKVCGYNVVLERNNVRERIGIVFQDPCIDKYLTGRENLEFHGRLYHMDSRKREERIAEVLELMDLRGWENTRVEDCSGGIQRRFEVARGFMNHPEVLFLDEPTLGMDIQTRRGLWDYIRMLNEREGMTVVLTTHYIEEADFLCHRVAIINEGKIAAVDTPGKLKEVAGLNLVSLQIAEGLCDGMVNSLDGLAWVKEIKSHDGLLELRIEGGEERIPELVELADEHGLDITAIDFHQPSLEDAFLCYTGTEIREEEGRAKEFRMAGMAGRRR